MTRKPVQPKRGSTAHAPSIRQIGINAARLLLDLFQNHDSCISTLYIEPSSAFWTQPERPLTMEISVYQITLPATGWMVTGVKPGTITISSPSGLPPARLVKAEKTLLAFFDQWTDTTRRGEIYDLKYYLREYRSDKPICDCRAPR